MNARCFHAWKGSLLFALTAISVALGTAAAIAEIGTTKAPTISLKYYAIETSTPEGVAALYDRILEAAREVCARFRSDNLTGHSAWNGCYSQAVNNAVAAVHKPMLTDLHKRRGGGLGPQD